MSEFDYKSYMGNLNRLQFSGKTSQCWNDLELGIRMFAKKSRTELSGNSAFQCWWNSCFNLLASRQVCITAINFKPSSAGEDEFITITNTGPAIVDLSGWTLNAGDNKQDLCLLQGLLIYPKQELVLYTQNKGELNFNSSLNIWNNKGDTGLLYDNNGQLISSLAYGSDAHSQVEISAINYDGQEKRTEADEYAELSNLGGTWIDLSGWQLTAGKGQIFLFPENTKLAPFSYIRVYTNQVHPESGGYSFGSSTAIWNNSGDIGVLTDYMGRQVSEYLY